MRLSRIAASYHHGVCPPQCMQVKHTYREEIAKAEEAVGILNQVLVEVLRGCGDTACCGGVV